MVALQAKLILRNPDVAAFTDPLPIRNRNIPSTFTNPNNAKNDASGSSRRFFTLAPTISMSSHAAENSAGKLVKRDRDPNRGKSGGLLAKRDRLFTVMKAATEQGLRVLAKRPDIDGGQRYRSKDWFMNILSLPNSFVLRRIRFHLLTNTIMSALIVLINRYFFRVEIPLIGHTLLGG